MYISVSSSSSNRFSRLCGTVWDLRRYAAPLRDTYVYTGVLYEFI